MLKNVFLSLLLFYPLKKTETQHEAVCSIVRRDGNDGKSSKENKSHKEKRLKEKNLNIYRLLNNQIIPMQLYYYDGYNSMHNYKIV